MELHIGKTKEAVTEDIAAMITALANESVGKHGKFTWALSGGSSPKALFALLVSKYAETFPWASSWFYFGDERYVPHDHEDSNYRMARQAMLDPMKIPAEHIFPVDTSLSPADAAAAYQKAITTSFGSDYPVFDLVLLGLGDDAHTASLFPGTDVLHNDTSLVSDVFLPKKEVYRVTFTRRLINDADTVAFLTFGSNKADAVRQVLRKEGDPTMYPAQYIDPASGNLHWYIDDAAASGIR